MSATTLVAARLEPNLKERAERTIKSNDLTTSDVIRRVYEYIVVTGDVPEFVKTDEYDVRIVSEKDRFSAASGWLRNGPLSKYDFTGLSDDEISRELASQFESHD